MGGEIKKILLVVLIAVASAVKAQEVIDPYMDNLLTKMTSYYMKGIDEKLYLQLDKPYYSSGDQIWFKGYLRNAITHAPLELSNFIYVELVGERDELISRVKVKRDSTAGFNGYLLLDAQMTPGDYTLRGYTQWMRNKSEDYFFQRAIKIISPIVIDSEATAKEIDRSAVARAKDHVEESFDVQFFPEGGALMAGDVQSVAFKAIGEDGLSVNVAGDIYNSKGESVSALGAQYKGMGLTSFYVSADECYHAMVSCEGGEPQRFDLPAVEQIGAVLTAIVTDDKLIYKVRATDPKLLDGARVVVNSHGRVVSVSGAQNQMAQFLSMQQLFDGVNIISLVDAQNQVLSERLIFKYPNVLPSVDIKANSDNYGRREKAHVKLSLKDSFGQAAHGEFAVSVTDNNSVKLRNSDCNIYSYMLLTSDLQGYVEDPGLYFAESSRKANNNVDLLMRTQGWRRFDLEKILCDSIPNPTYPFEDVVRVSGRVNGFFGNAARSPIIHVLNAQKSYFDTFMLGSSSGFMLTGLDLPDSTNYVIQARGRKGGTMLTLNIEPETFPESVPTIYPRGEEQAYIPQSFVNQSQDKFFYDGGMNLIDIDAVYVTADDDNISESHASASSRATSREELETMSGLSLQMIIQFIPGMSVSEEGVRHRGDNSFARFVLDGAYVEFDEVSSMLADEIESMEFLSAMEAVIYSDASGGAFVIKSREGYSASQRPLSIVNLERLGYQRKMSLYQPRYGVASLKENLPPDYRTTIFWDGTLAPDENGNIDIEFYTADSATSYTICIEGMTPSGEIIRGLKSVERTADR